MVTGSAWQGQSRTGSQGQWPAHLVQYRYVAHCALRSCWGHELLACWDESDTTQLDLPHGDVVAFRIR